MASYEVDDIKKVFPAPNGSGGAVLPVVEKPGGGMKNLESGAGEARQFWASVEESAREVESWPEWRRASARIAIEGNR